MCAGICPQRAEEALDALKLESQIVSNHMGSGSLIYVLCKSKKCC